MADIAASDVTYTLNAREYSVGEGYVNDVSLTFGNGALTYPSLGVPLTKGKQGCPNNISRAVFVDAAPANGFLYKYDTANNKIRIYQGDNPNAAAAANIELVGGTATPAAATIRMSFTGY